ncbi:MAG: hypothetical protein IT379_36455 [Deltaproteobacteria bacterium]|nr:hypothetical protein [Deltaproteobacteria bacterium]
MNPENRIVRATVRVTLLAALCVLAIGCEGAPRDEARRETATLPAAASSTTARVELGEEASILYERTLVRDPVPSCAQLTAGLARPVAALLEVVERTTAPPSSGMRAATCLVREHAAEIEPQMTQWVRQRATMGLGLLVLAELDRLESALGDRLARAALAGDFADRARPRIARSARHAHLVAGSSDSPGGAGTVAPR